MCGVNGSSYLKYCCTLYLSMLLILNRAVIRKYAAEIGNVADPIASFV